MMRKKKEVVRKTDLVVFASSEIICTVHQVFTGHRVQLIILISW